jgi:hypothetical protein
MGRARERPGNLQRSCVMRQHRPLPLLSLLIGLAVPSMAGAQNPQPAPPQVTHPPLAPPSAATPPPEKIAPPDHTAPGDTTLSERLSQQHGTLKPPPVDPGMQLPLPPRSQGGAMPVIPPPGTPGGDQKVVPK